MVTLIQNTALLLTMMIVFDLVTMVIASLRKSCRLPHQ